jgi:hypothetical protein
MSSQRVHSETRTQNSLCERNASFNAQQTKEVTTQRCTKSMSLLIEQNRHLSNNIPETAVAYLEYNLGANPEKIQTKFPNTDDIQGFSSRKNKGKFDNQKAHKIHMTKE